MFNDPYPRKLWLGAAELEELLDMDKSTFYEFLRDPTTGFPLPLDAGATTGKGRKGKRTSPPGRRRRWDKYEVYRWMMARPRLSNAPEPRAPSPKRERSVRIRPDPSGTLEPDQS